ncbi:MAG TPA: phage Gp37/Gp68 family protein [Kofleriaceae bacterium]|nr:phage Gp37/Gp68 family protein [Kofleriaceae bacterium]
MSDIEWTDRTWNPIVGCARVSPGCEHCYAERFVHRGLSPQHKGLTVMRNHGPGWTGEVRLVESALAKPLSWRKPQRVFVNSLSDLWHEGVSNETCAAIFGVMAATPHITYQVLTKRPERMRAWFSWVADEGDEVLGAVGEEPDGHDGQVAAACAMYAKEIDCGGVLTRDGFRNATKAAWPLLNVWIGVTAEDQQRADERIPLLLDTPAAVRFVSYEPALGPIDFRIAAFNGADSIESLEGLHWLIVGGESGPGARPFDLAWARSAVEQCKAAGVRVFVKQLGAQPCLGEPEPTGNFRTNPETGKREYEYALPRFVTKHRKGNDPSEWPEDLRVREFPR